MKKQVVLPAVMLAIHMKALVLVFIAIILAGGSIFGAEIDVQLAPASYAAPGDIIAVNLYIASQDEWNSLFFDGFDMSFTYDSTFITPWGIQYHSFFDSAGWFVSFRDDFLVMDSVRNRVVHIYAQARDDSSSFSIHQFQQEPVLTALFMTAHDSSLYGLRTGIDFLWGSCKDNRLWVKNNPTVFLADSVFDASRKNITNPNTVFPTITGPSNACFISNGDTLVASNAMYYSTEIVFLPFDSVGNTGDINLNGSCFDTTDLALFTAFFLHGDSVFSLAHDKQIAATDIDHDLNDTTLADLVLTRYALLQQEVPPVSRSQPKAQFIYDTTAGAVSISVNAEIPVGAYFIRLVKDFSQVDSIVLEHANNTGDYGQARAIWNADTASMLFLGGIPTAPVIGAGVTHLATMYHSGIAPTPVVEHIASIEGTNCLLQTPTEVKEYTGDQLPQQFMLLQNYPNPFNPSTVIEFTLPTHAHWEMEIINVLGQTVQSYQGINGPGMLEVRWDGMDMHSQPVSSGVYFYLLITQETVHTKKMVLIR